MNTVPPSAYSPPNVPIDWPVTTTTGQLRRVLRLQATRAPRRYRPGWVNPLTGGVAR